MPEGFLTDPQVTEFLRQSAAAAIVLLIGVLAYQLLSRGVQRLQHTGRLSDHLTKVVRRVLRWAVAIVLVLSVFQCYGLLANAWTAITAVLGLVAIGFVAVWSVLSNVLCSLMLIISRPFEVGDYIIVPSDELSGRVIDFNLLFTKLKDDHDGTTVQIPNNLFFQKAIRRRESTRTVTLDEQLMRDEPAAA